MLSRSTDLLSRRMPHAHRALDALLPMASPHAPLRRGLVWPSTDEIVPHWARAPVKVVEEQSLCATGSPRAEGTTPRRAYPSMAAAAPARSANVKRVGEATGVASERAARAERNIPARIRNDQPLVQTKHRLGWCIGHVCDQAQGQMRACEWASGLQGEVQAPCWGKMNR